MREKSIDGLRVAGHQHDIGKVSLPIEILTKPACLNSNGYGMVKEHARLGFDILKGVEFPWPVAEGVLQHHERLDGSDYPNGLRNEQILPEAKLLAVADTVEAIASDRPYRAAVGIEPALTEIETHRGSLYDSDAVDACIQLFRVDNFRFGPAAA
jgi:HD-GYP domain-containing protein (c-di-GMP phosphodiesterase class II)